MMCAEQLGFLMMIVVTLVLAEKSTAQSIKSTIFNPEQQLFYYKVPNLIFLQMSEYQAGDKVLFVLGNMNSEKRVWNQSILFRGTFRVIPQCNFERAHFQGEFPRDFDMPFRHFIWVVIKAIGPIHGQLCRKLTVKKMLCKMFCSKVRVPYKIYEAPICPLSLCRDFISSREIGTPWRGCGKNRENGHKVEAEESEGEGRNFQVTFWHTNRVTEGFSCLVGWQSNFSSPKLS